jgi:hypothetical protein
MLTHQQKQDKERELEMGNIGGILTLETQQDDGPEGSSMKKGT